MRVCKRLCARACSKGSLRSEVDFIEVAGLPWAERPGAVRRSSTAEAGSNCTVSIANVSVAIASEAIVSIVRRSSTTAAGSNCGGQGGRVHLSVKQAWRMQGAEGAEGAAGAEVLLLLLPGLRECVGRCRSQSDETRLPQRWRFLRLGFEPSRRPEHGRRASTAGPVATVAASDAPLIPALLGSEARGGAGEGCGGRGAMTRRRHAWRVSIWPRLRTVTPTVRPGQLPSSRARHEAAA